MPFAGGNVTQLQVQNVEEPLNSNQVPNEQKSEVQVLLMRIAAQ